MALYVRNSHTATVNESKHRRVRHTYDRHTTRISYSIVHAHTINTPRNARVIDLPRLKSMKSNELT